ncbi:MAG: hypothetical protein EA398_15950 [Deltaproteobacteria bacterium]|nr:MAG: hypothetical protein EA398_15950 [Deltaproteobacteria bacterium]
MRTSLYPWAIALLASGLWVGCSTELERPEVPASLGSTTGWSSPELSDPRGGAEPSGTGVPSDDATDPGDVTGSSSERSGSGTGSNAGESEERPPVLVLPGTGVVGGTFAERPEAAFDGETERDAEEAATTGLFEGQWREFLLFREFVCPMRLQRLEVHAPVDAPFVFDEQFYPDGGTGTLHVVARRSNQRNFSSIAQRPYDAGSPVVFTAEELPNATGYVAYGVAFESDDPFPGTLRVAEVAMFGFCSAPAQEIAWHTGPWLCKGVECAAAVNEGGTAERTVGCLREDGNEADERLCAGSRPDTDGGDCALECPYRLRYVGYREFTYANGSGWLHEGRAGRRAGPLPRDVTHGQTREDIEGAFCEVLTEHPQAAFVGISCVEEDSDPRRYCAFRCEEAE